MLKLKTLKFQNIGRFIEPQEINFNNFNNLVQIDAQNNNTGGSSGSGKSTIFNAIDWLLGLSNLSTSILQSRLTDKHISVEGLFDWDGREAIIHRSRKLSITIDGIETIGSSKLTEEKLDEIIGMPRDLFHRLLHKRQGDQGFFLNLTPAKMNEFLTDCLGLSSISSKIDLIDQKIKDLTQNKTRFESDLQAHKASLQATKDALVALGVEPTTNVTEAILADYKVRYEEAQQCIGTATSENNLTKGQLENKRPKVSVEPFDRTCLQEIEKNIKSTEDGIKQVVEIEQKRVAAINQEISTLKLDVTNKTSALTTEHTRKMYEINSQLKEFKYAVQAADASKVEALKIAGQIKTIRDGLCQTCNQSWVTDKAKQEEQRLLQEIDKHKTSIQAGNKASAQICTLESMVNDLNVEYNKQLSDISKQFESKLAEFIESTKSYLDPIVGPSRVKIEQLRTLKKEELEKEVVHNAEQNSKNQSILKEFAEAQKALYIEQESVMSKLRIDLEGHRSTYQQCVSSLDAWKNALARYRQTSDSLNSKLEETNQKLVQMNSKLVQSIEDLEIAEEAKRCLKSYLSCSFDDSLDSISDTATRILRAVPTMANATIRLEGTKESNNGSIKNQVNACLDNDGEIEIPIKSLSGGERSAVDLAVDLAVSEFIAERSKAGINLLCLDEVMNGFDTFGKECAIEMIKALGSDRHVLIIEHDPIVKELITERIIVIRDGETSSIK
jgi:ABC-type lipoprotein export system ATPase subunit